MAPPLEPPRPTTALGWLVFAWAIAGTVAVLLEATIRLALRAALLFVEPEPVPIAVAAVWSGFMVWTEGWRGFHQRFNPRVVVRAARLEDRPWWAQLLAPLVAMGLLHATPRRLVSSWLLVAVIVLLIVGIRQLPEPWRAAVDLGVVLGLSVGTVSLVVHTVRCVRGRAVPVDPDFPS